MTRFNHFRRIHQSRYYRRSAPIWAALALTVLLTALSPSGLFAAPKRTLDGIVVGGLDIGEYSVKAVLTVPVGDTLRIGAGAKLYFEPLTGIDVRGALLVDGALGLPVIMTSSTDTAGAAEAPQAFDWNGVRSFGPGASVVIRHASVSNSVYGLQIWDTLSRAELQDVAFSNNGYASLMRNGEIVPVTVDKVVNMAWNTDTPPVSSAKPVSYRSTKTKINTNTTSQHRINAKFIINVSALTVAAAGITTCYIGLSNTNTYNNHNTPNNNNADYYKEKIQKNTTASAIGAIATGVGLGCIGVTLFF